MLGNTATERMFLDMIRAGAPLLAAQEDRDHIVVLSTIQTAYDLDPYCLPSIKICSDSVMDMHTAAVEFLDWMIILDGVEEHKPEWVKFS